MSAIFLSYRRDDSSGYAGRLFDNLAQRFSREQVFMDIETLEPGMDFVAGIDRAIASCGALIAMIGPNWTKAQDSEGRRRLDDPHDFIRLEITTALNRGVRVIPVLVHNARMPLEDDLPEPLRPLCRLQACEISDNRWDFDVSRLADVLDPLIREPKNDPTPAASVATAPAAATGAISPPGEKADVRTRGWLTAVIVVFLATVGGAWWFSQSPPGEKMQSPIEQPVAPPPDVASRNGEPMVTKERESEVQPGPVPAASEPTVEPLSQPTLPSRAPFESQPTVGPEPVAAPMPPAPSPEELRQREVAELIRAAEADLENLRLTRPAGNNAYERFKRVLELEPGNTTAREGLIAITERYHRMVEQSLDSGDLDSAQRHLDSAHTVDARAHWLTPTQSEIDQRRQVMTGSGQPLEPAPRADGADREACLSACERRHQACRADIDTETEANCLSKRAETCEQLYQDCMSDTSKMYMGQIALRSECAGVNSKCSKSAAQDCAAASRITEKHCQADLDACVSRCSSTE